MAAINEKRPAAMTEGMESEMFSHVTVGTRDLERSGRFYDAVLVPLGLKRRIVVPDGGPAALCWVSAHAALPRFYVYSPYNGEPATVGNGSMAAFLAPSTAAVNTAYADGLAHGGRDAGARGRVLITGRATTAPICAILTATKSISFIVPTSSHSAGEVCISGDADMIDSQIALVYRRDWTSCRRR